MHRCVKGFWAALGGVVLLAAVPAAQAEGWGTVKGQVVFDGPVPQPKPLDVNKDQATCLAKGPILSEEFVVNPKNKGVRWAVVYLIDQGGFAKDLPLNPALKEIKEPNVEVDQPHCRFEPHIVALREGQGLVAKNSAGVAHNVNIAGGVKGPNLNQILPPGGKLTVGPDALVARATPITVACNIHGWMKGYVFVLKNPYFAVTDADGKFEIKGAPAGKCRMVIWQDNGWVVGNPSPSKNGVVVDVKADGVTDLGEIKLKP
jgi:hypothetical protein